MNSLPQPSVDQKKERLIQIAISVLIGAGVLFFALDLVLDWKINFALPILFFFLGGGFFTLEKWSYKRWNGAIYLLIPGYLMTTFGIIFLLDVFTNNWGSWAYAWLLLPASVGLGLLMVNRELKIRKFAEIIGWGLAVGGVTFFVIFGAIAGGLFIDISALLILIALGLAVVKFRPHFLFGGDLKEENLQKKEAVLHSPQPLAEPLSPRELEVLRCIDVGLSNQQIALRLSVAPSTVKTHINNIYGKLGVENRVQALKRAGELRLLETDSDHKNA